MTFLQQLFADTQFPLLTAFLLGLLVAIHPCPMATNIAAMGFIVKDAARSGVGDSGRRVFAGGLLYTLGRIAAYSLLGIALVAAIRGGVQMASFGRQMSLWGERLLSPLLIGIGLYLLYNDLLHHHDHVPATHSPETRFRGAWGSILLGILFALAFCPESGIVYFGMIVPMSVEAPAGYLLPVGFALGTALPTVFLAWVFAYSIQSYARVSRRIHLLQVWLTRIVAVVFILAGVICLFF